MSGLIFSGKKMLSAAVVISAVRVKFPAKLYDLTNIPDEF